MEKDHVGTKNDEFWQLLYSFRKSTVASREDVTKSLFMFVDEFLQW